MEQNKLQIDILTEDEILKKLEKSRKHATDGMYRDAEDIVRDMRDKYGL